MQNASQFDAQFQAAAVPALRSRYGKKFVYRKRCGLQRTVMAISINNLPPEELSDVPGGIAYRWVVEVENDEIAGIASSEIDTGGDKVDIEERVGGRATTHIITRVLFDQGGITQFEVR